MARGQDPAPVPTSGGLLGDPRIGDAKRAELLRLFADGLNQKVAQFETALRQSDTGALIAVLHKLQGTAGLYGFDQIAELAGGAEKRLHTGASLDEVRERVVRLLACCRGHTGSEETSAPRSSLPGPPDS